MTLGHPRARPHRQAGTAAPPAVDVRGGFLRSGHSVFTSLREAIVTLASRHAVPAIYPLREFAASGGLISYGAASPDHIGWPEAMSESSSRAPSRPICRSNEAAGLPPRSQPSPMLRGAMKGDEGPLS